MWIRSFDSNKKVWRKCKSHLQENSAPKTIGIMKKRRTDSLVSNSAKLTNNPGCSIDSQIHPVIISGSIRHQICPCCSNSKLIDMTYYTMWPIKMETLYWQEFSITKIFSCPADDIGTQDSRVGNFRCGTPSPPTTGLIEDEASCGNNQCQSYNFQQVE